MQVGVDVMCMHTSFGVCGFFGFRDMATFQKQLRKFMQVGINVTYMHTNFGGRDFSGFGDIATFQKRANFPFGAWAIVHGHQKF